ncbi:hypothetical protein [Samia cynthia nucleopolyhedrovirus]|nr:hypothetical protein [Antheraea yamamai nucleopolyhedrovirus]BBD50649.1 hypothetical protein [Samia cynthia nucleopolyhedrovirus]
MATTAVPYSFVQQAVINELQFLNASVTESVVGFFSYNHVSDELQNVLQIATAARNADQYLQTCDIKSLNLLTANIQLINFNYSDEPKQALKKRLLELLPDKKEIVSKYDRELDSVLNYSYISQIKSLDNIEVTHKKLACVLCYTAMLPSRNSVWYLPDNENRELFAGALSKYLLNVLAMIKNKDRSLDRNVRVVYHVGVPDVRFGETMNPNLISVDSSPFQSRPSDLEVCYAMRNKLFLGNAGEQHTDVCAQFPEVNGIPYCLYNAELPDNFAAGMFNLYKLESQKKLKLGNVLFVNTMRTGAKESIVNTINAYYNACQYVKNAKLQLRVVGNYKGYQHDYKMAALDFAILMFATNAANCYLKYVMMNVHERMFMELKKQVCRLPPQKVYEALLNYDVEIEPSINFSADTVDAAFK